MTTCKSSKNIIFITGPHLDDPGGVANYYNSIIPELKKLEHLDIFYHSIGSTASLNSKFIHLFSDQLRTFRAIKSIKPDLVLVNPSLNLKSFLRDALIVSTAVALSVRVVVFYRGWDNEFEKRIDRYFVKLFKKTFAKADSVIVLASEHGERLRSWGLNCPIFKESTTVASHIAINSQEAVEKRIKIESKILKILFLSRIEKDKGIYETIEAITCLVKKGFSIYLTIAGDGSEMNKIKRHIKKKELDNFVSMPGYLKGTQKRKALFSHDVLCLPTKHGEGMPNSILEAMMSGLVVLTTNHGGIKDFFQDGRMGFLVNPYDKRDMVERLELLFENKLLRHSIGLYNHNYAMKNFSSRVVVQRLCAIFDNLLKDS